MNPDQNKYTFKFLSYYFNKDDLTATFCYQGIDNVIFTENVIFDKNPDGVPFNPTNDPQLNELLDRAVFLAYILSGTSYYKAHPTPFIQLEVPLDAYQAGFFSLVYQEGLSQFAFENQLVRQLSPSPHNRTGEKSWRWCSCSIECRRSRTVRRR